jgi:hypothetical protein
VITVVLYVDGITVPDSLQGTTTVVATITVVTAPVGAPVGAPETVEAQVMIAGLLPIWFTQIPWK